LVVHRKPLGFSLYPGSNPGAGVNLKYSIMILQRMPELEFITDGSDFFYCLDNHLEGSHFLPFKFEYMFGHLYITPAFSCTEIADNSPPGLGDVCRDESLSDAEAKKKATELWEKHDQLVDLLLHELEKGLPPGTRFVEYCRGQGERFKEFFYDALAKGLKLDGSMMPFGIINPEGRMKKTVQKRGYVKRLFPGTPEKGILQEVHYLGL